LIKLDKFVKAIQEAVLRANEGLVDSGLNSLVSKFFDGVGGDTGDLQQSLDEALDATGSIKDGESLKKAREALKNARQALAGDGHVTEGAQTPGSLKAKTVVVEYPMIIDGQLEFKEVHVPLVTLVPLNFSAIEKLKLETDVELHVVGEDLEINFGKSSTLAKMFGKGQRSPGRLEIVLQPDAGPEGIKLLIDGYERVLRAQIPS